MANTNSTLQKEMFGEFNNLLIVWCYIYMSSCYCYAITKLLPKGTLRFLIIFLPLSYLYFHLPLRLKPHNFSVPTAFLITWLSSFKLLLLAFAAGPLSNPSLSLSQFFLFLSFPINLSTPKPKPQQKPAYDTGLRSPSYYAKKTLFLVFLIVLGDFRHKIPRDIVLFLICIYIYTGLEVVLGCFGLLGQALLGTKLDGPFDDPYLSTSLQDFWGRRWNRAASSSLRATVFHPTVNYTSPLLGRKWAVNLGLVGTFVVSDVMHEILFYYMGRVRFAWGTPLFFFLHGLLVAGEISLKERINVKWRLPQKVIGPMIFGFVIFTFMRLVLPELLVHNVDDQMLAEYAAFAGSVKDLGLFWIKMGYNLIARVAAQVT